MLSLNEFITFRMRKDNRLREVVKTGDHGKVMAEVKDRYEDNLIRLGIVSKDKWDIDVNYLKEEIRRRRLG